MTTEQTSGSSAPFHVYVSNFSNQGSVNVLSVTSATEPPEIVQTLELAPLIPEPTASVACGTVSYYPSVHGLFGVPMTISPDKRFLYVGYTEKALPIFSFAIDEKSRELSLLGMGRLPAASGYVVTDRTGRFVFTSAPPSGATLAVSAIDANGVVAPRAHQVLHIDHRLHGIAISPDNRHLYVGSSADETISQFEFDAEAGLLTPLDPPFVKLRDGGDPRHLLFSPDGRYLYTNTELRSDIVRFSVDTETGQLTEESSIEIPAGPQDRGVATGYMEGFTGKAATADLHFTPDGRFLYVSERLISRLIHYSVDQETGDLSLLGEVETEVTPRAFAISPDGSFLLAAAIQTGKLIAYSIDPENGNLEKGFSIDIGMNPSWVEFMPA